MAFSLLKNGEVIPVLEISSSGLAKELSFLTLPGTSVADLLGEVTNNNEVEACRQEFLDDVTKRFKAEFPSKDFKFDSKAVIGKVSGEPVVTGGDYKIELKRAIFIPEEIRGWHNIQSYTLRCSGKLSQTFQKYLKEGDILIISGGKPSIYNLREWTKTYLDLVGLKAKIVHLRGSGQGMQSAGAKYAQVVNGNRQRDSFTQRKGLLFEDHDDNNNIGHATLERKNKRRPRFLEFYEPGTSIERRCQPIDGLQKCQSMKDRMKIGSGATKGNLFWTCAVASILGVMIFIFFLFKCLPCLLQC